MAINDCFGKLNAGKEIFSTEEQSEVRSLVVNLMSGRSQKDAERAAVDKLLQDAINERKDISALVREELGLPAPEAVPVSSGDSPKLSTDNPNDPEWLAGEREIASARGYSEHGTPSSFGAATAVFDKPILVPVDKLAGVKGRMGEQQNVRQKALDGLVEHMGSRGKLPKGMEEDEHHPFIQVDQHGIPYVNEGNHRIMAAKKLGWKYLPVRVQYHLGGEEQNTTFNPKTLIEEDKALRDTPRFSRDEAKADFSFLNEDSKPARPEGMSDEDYLKYVKKNERISRLTKLYGGKSDYENFRAMEKVWHEGLKASGFLGHHYFAEDSFTVESLRKKSDRITRELEAAEQLTPIDKLGNGDSLEWEHHVDSPLGHIPSYTVKFQYNDLGTGKVLTKAEYMSGIAPHERTMLLYADGLKTKEPFLRITVSESGELTIHGPVEASTLFTYMKSKGWAELATAGKDNAVAKYGDGTSWTRLKDVSGMQLTTLLGRIHAMAKGTAGTEYESLYWTRATGATAETGDDSNILGRKGTVMFSRAIDSKVVDGKIEGERVVGEWFDEQMALRAKRDKLDLNLVSAAIIKIGSKYAQRGYLSPAHPSWGEGKFVAYTMRGDGKIASAGTPIKSEKILAQESFNSRTTTEENFKAWTGGIDKNNVVEDASSDGGYNFKTGVPFVAKVYHGSPNTFYEFSNAELGSNTKAGSATLGHFAAGSIGTSSSYTSNMGLLDDDYEETLDGDITWEDGEPWLDLKATTHDWFQYKDSIRSVKIDANNGEEGYWSGSGFKTFASRPEMAEGFRVTSFDPADKTKAEYFVSIDMPKEEWDKLSPRSKAIAAAWGEAVSNMEDYNQEAEVGGWAKQISLDENKMMRWLDDDISESAVVHLGAFDSAVYTIQKDKDGSWLALKNGSTIGAYGWKPDAAAAVQDEFSRDFDSMVNGGGGGRIMNLYLSAKNPYVHDYKGDVYREKSYFSVITKAKKKGHDSVVLTNTFDGGDIDNIFVFFNPAQVKDVNENVGTFDAKNPDIRFSRKTPFYSQLEKGLERTEDRIFKQNPTGKQFLLWLNANAGKLKIQKSEVYWTGLEDWLNTVEGKITKADIMAIVKGGGIQTTDVMLRNDAISPSLLQAFAKERLSLKWSDSTDGFVVTDYQGNYVPERELPSNLRNLLNDAEEDVRNDSQGSTQYEDYVVAGGKDYRELLITLPTVAENIDEQIAAVEKRIEAMDELSQEFANEGNADKSQSFKEKAQVNRWKLEDLKKTKAQTKISGNFKSNHFGGRPNILGHIRFDTRTDDQGRKVMFLEELQSDWGQKAKKEGFDVPKPAYRVIVDGLQAMTYATREEADAHAERALKYNAPDKVQVQEVNMKHGKGLPLAPHLATKKFAVMIDGKELQSKEDKDGKTHAIRFQTQLDAEAEAKKHAGATVEDLGMQADTAAWVSLLLKKAIAHAVETGHEVIAWANGEQNAEHYDLSKQVSKIQYGKHPDGTYTIIVYTPNQNGMNSYDHQTVEEIEELIGKDMATKIVNGEGVPDKDGIPTFSGLDLKVGGEGMKHFYDVIVPSNAKSVLAKAGGGKVEMINIGNVTDNRTATKRNNDGTFSIIDLNANIGAENEFSGNYITREEAEAARIAKAEGMQQGFVITPLLREKVQVEGLPMFARSGNQAPAETKMDAVARTLQDKMRRFAVIRDWLKEQGHAISEAADVWMAEGNMHGKVSTRTEDFRDKKVKPLIERTQKAGFSMGQVAEYMEALHIPEANARIQKIHNDPTATANGVTDAEAKAVLDEYKKLKNFAELDKIASEWRSITTDTRGILVSSGIISQDMADAWAATYKNYVPLKGDGKDVQVGTGKGLSVNGKTKKRLGHSIRDEAVIQHILRDHERAIQLSEKNAVGIALIRMAVEANNPDLITIDQPKKRQVMKSGQAHYIVTYFGSDVEVFDNLNDARRARERMAGQAGTNKLDLGIRTSYEPDTVVLMASPMLADNEVNVYVNGQAVRMQINDELLARAYTNMGVEHVGMVLSAAQGFNRWLSAAYTGYNPEFALVNMMRDLFAGSINLTGDYGVGMTAKIFANYPKAFKELVRSFKDPSSSQWVSDYRAAGGSTGASYLSDIERIGTDIMNSYNEAAGGVDTFARVKQEEIDKGRSKGYASLKASAKAGQAVFHEIPVIGHFLKLMQRVNAVTENALRVATYVTLKENGVSNAKAAQAAKMSTVNFNRKGEVTATAGALYLFFNPNIQGTQRLFNVLTQSKNKGQAQAAVAMMIAGAYFLSQALSGDDDDDRWKNIPDQVKDRNIVFFLGEKQITIPLPYGYGVFWSLGNGLSNVMNGADAGKESARMGNALFNNFSPLGNPVEGGEVRMNAVYPTILKMAAAPNEGPEGTTGLGTPMTPRKYLEAKPDSENMYRGTYGTWYADMAKFMNGATGGDALNKGAVDVSPETIKYWVTSLTGGAGRFIGDTVAVGQISAQGGDLELNEIPVLRKFLREGGVKDSRSLYYKNLEETKEAADLFSLAKSRAKLTRDPADIEALQDVTKENMPAIRMAKFADAYATSLKYYKEELYRITQSKMTLAEKRLQIKMLEKKEQEIYDRFNAEFESKMDKK